MEESKPGPQGDEANSAGQSTTSIYKQEQAIRKVQPKDKAKQSVPNDTNAEPKPKPEHTGIQPSAIPKPKASPDRREPHKKTPSSGA